MRSSTHDVDIILVDLDFIITFLNNKKRGSPEKEKNKYKIKSSTSFFLTKVDFEFFKKIDLFLSKLIKYSKPVIIIANKYKKNKNFLANMCKKIKISKFIFLSFKKNFTNIFFSITKKTNTSIFNVFFLSNKIFFLKTKKTVGMNLTFLNKNTGYINNFFLNNNIQINKLDKIFNVIEKNIRPKKGKIPNYFLNILLSKYKTSSNSIIVGPSIGEDTAVVKTTKSEVLVIKSDPITFSTKKIGYYTVLININDMVTSGIIPKWLVCVIMFPVKTSILKIEKTFKVLYKACIEFNIVLCGGHTEVTNAVSRIIIVGTMLGIGGEKNIIKKARIKSGDVLVMTKSAGIEGTAIISSEFKKQLLKKKLSIDYISKCLTYKNRLSILKEARVAWNNIGVSALHDVTEGGVITAILELASHSNFGIKIFLNQISISKKTKTICKIMNINPLGLIGSGSLLISCREKHVDALLNSIKKNKISAKIIGKFTKSKKRSSFFNLGEKCDLVLFEVDEITKIL